MKHATPEAGDYQTGLTVIWGQEKHHNESISPTEDASQPSNCRPQRGIAKCALTSYPGYLRVPMTLGLPLKETVLSLHRTAKRVGSTNVTLNNYYSQQAYDNKPLIKRLLLSMSIHACSCPAGSRFAPTRGPKHDETLVVATNLARGLHIGRQACNSVQYQPELHEIQH